MSELKEAIVAAHHVQCTAGVARARHAGMSSGGVEAPVESLASLAGEVD